MRGFNRASIAGDSIAIIWVDDMIDVFTWRHAFGIPILTPNLDRLFARGVRFGNAYATVPLCAPCRAELATGLSPFRTGLVDLNRVWRDIHPPHKSWAYDLRRAGFYNFTTGKVDATYRPMPERYRRILFHEDPPCTDKSGRDKIKAYLGAFGGLKWQTFVLKVIQNLKLNGCFENEDGTWDDFEDTAGGCDETAWDVGMSIIEKEALA